MSEIGVGLVGYKFMGRAHSNAYRQVARFFDVEPTPRMRAICGRDEEAVRSAAGALGWEGYETDYARMLERDDIQLVDISSSGDTLAEAREMVEAARRAGTLNMVCHNYRRAPAVLLAKKLIDEGRLGEIRHWRAVYLQDWLLDPAAPMTWRLRKETGGAGPLADLGSHLVDLAHFLVGPIAEVIGTAETFIKERPRERAGGTNLEMDRVT